MIRHFSLVAAMALVAVDSAQSSITTTFVDNNGRSTPGVTVYFDMQLNVGIGITAFDLNCIGAVGLNGTIDVYTTQQGGTYVGNQSNASAWTQVTSSTPFLAAGRGVPTNAPLASPISLAPGSYGIAIRFNGVGTAYTNGNGTNQSYSNADMALSLGSATAALFSGTFFDPRVFNGTIYYTIGTNFARAVPYGAGCGTPALVLAGVARPVIGTTASAQTSAIPNSALGGILMFGFTPIDPGIELTPIGMPGCRLYLGSDASVNFASGGASALHTLSIPNAPSLAGVSLNLQSVVVAPGANQLGAITSNGLRWIFDVQ